MNILLCAILAVVVLALVYIMSSYTKVKGMNEGNEEMKNLASIIRAGANTFIKIEFKTIAIVVIVLAIIFSLFVEKTSGLTFILGAMMSSFVCIMGMRSATYANVRTSNRARETYSLGKEKSIFETMKVALTGGGVSGLGVQALGTFGILFILFVFGEINPNAESHGLVLKTVCNPTIVRITTYSLGCSIVAMFNRVAGGNFTKAADISSDIVGKNRYGLPEDDPRIPSTIADFIGDNVNDIAGNCSDLLESYVATIVASMMMSVIVFGKSSVELFKAAIMFPLLLAGVGLLSCIIGVAISSHIKMSNSASKQLNMATYISAGITVIGSFVACAKVFGKMESIPEVFKLGWVSPWISAILGILSGVLIGIITEIFTSSKYHFVQDIAKISKEGTAFNVTMGDGLGFISCFPPMALIGIAIMISSKLCGNYGIAISALGMLSFVGTTVSIDAFGPIADNAGGIVEACHLPEELRDVTDELDSIGNTTAAIGKGFAIGSAAFATISMIISFIGNFSQNVDLNIADGKVMGGAIFGGIIALFSGWLTRNTIESAQAMADESLEQIKQPGILEGTKRPDYATCINIATNRALKKMLAPSIIAIIVPVVCGFIFGAQFVGGTLVGATIIAIMLAIFMGNSGGAFDNAKKFIEAGGIPDCPKGSPAHKSSVDGDTIGDTRKDVVGVALDIFIKMMSTVANTLAPLFRI